jgi:hypothetical protein
MAGDLETLIKDDRLYAKSLSKIGRRWFTKAILEFVNLTNPADLKAAARPLLTKAKSMADSRAATSRTSLIDDLKALETKAIRTRIVYGVLGSNPGIFFDATPHDDVLDFLVERRYRIVQRMLSFINPNKIRKVVTYPAAGPLTAQVSAEARDFWVGTNPVQGNPAAAKRYPFVLTAAGKASPREAIEKLFTKHGNDADRTRIDCPAAAMAVHLDSLLVAHDPDKLMKTLAAVSNDYIALDHAYGPFRMIGSRTAGGFSGWVSAAALPGANSAMKTYGLPRMNNNTFDVVDQNGRLAVEATAVTRNTTDVPWNVQIPARTLVESTLTIRTLPRAVSVGAHFSEEGLPDYHAVSDPRPDQRLFEQVFTADTDLQTGDHIYVANHPFHRSRLSNTIWNGEHSFVLDPWSGSIGKMAVTGHGVTKLTVAQVAWIMLEEINIFLEITRRIVDAWLSIPAARVPLADPSADATFRAGLGELMLNGGPAAFDGNERIFNQPAFKYPKGGKDIDYAAYWLMELEGKLDGGTPAETPVDRKRVLIFDYNPARKTASTWPAASAFENGMLVVRSQAPVNLGGAAKTQYAVSYIDDLAGIPFFLPLYYPAGPKVGKPVRLGFDDILDSIGVRSPKPDYKIFTVRPSVRVDAPYLAFLKGIGAIA